jgi:protein TonB
MSRYWPAWTTGSLVVHAAVLALIFVAMPSRPRSHAGPAVMPVHLVALAPTHVSATPTPRREPVAKPRTQAQPQATAVLRRHRTSSGVLPAPAVARAAAPRPAPAHGQRQVAKAGAANAHTATPPPSDLAEAAAHDLDLVRQHLEHFKFYPEDARRRGIGGNVDIGFRLTHGGRVAQVRIASSSGYALLDHAAEAIVARAVPFPVDAGHYRVCLRFWP